MNYRFQPRLLLGLCALIAPLGFACAKVAPNALGGDGGHGGVNNGTGNSSSGTGNHGGGGTGVVPDSGVNGDGPCMVRHFKFAPRVPNVLVLVDGSGSMFQPQTGLPNGAWDALRTAVLPIVQDLQLTPDGQPQIDFGLGVFTGVAPSMCPIFQTVNIAENNYATIMSMYPTGKLSQMKLETPVTQVLPKVPPLFMGAPGNGGNYVLFVTDGEPDFCDDGNTTCPVDAVVKEIKDLNAMSITTYVIGLSSNFNTGTCPGVLQAYANAGVNQPIANPCPGHNIYDECNGNMSWKALAGGRATGQALVDYTTTGGTAQVFTPDVTNQQALSNTLAGLFSGVKSCTFDLNNLEAGEPPLKVDTTQLGGAQILIETTVVPLDNTNGWRVNCVPAGNPMCTPSQIELTGTFCDTWRLAANKNITFNFPCGVIVPG